MKNGILDVQVQTQALSPAAAEVRIVVRAWMRAPTLQLRGRLMGPSCPFASTVEVAYPMQPVPASPDGSGLAARVVIPEPSLWDPQSPFLYSGPVALWEGESRIDTVRIRHGLRQVRIGGRGLVINGQPLAIRAKRLAAACSDEAALQLRRAGYNLLLAPVAESTMPLWEVADRIGFLLVGRVEADSQTLDRVGKLRHHPSCVGWIAEDATMLVEGALHPDILDLFDSID